MCIRDSLSDRLYYSDSVPALLERIRQQFPSLNIGYPASGADHDGRKPDSHADDLHGDVGDCFFISNCGILSAGNAIGDAGAACDARGTFLYCLRRDVQTPDPE